MSILTKLKTTKLIELSIKVFAREGYSKLFLKIDREIEKRISQIYNLEEGKIC